MSDVEERVIAGLTVRIDRLLCVGFGDCLEPAGGALVFDDEGIATFTPQAGEATREQLVDACISCPVDAITLLDDGAQIAP